ncbi:hypothetical protein QMO46_03725 [Microbacterium barkeri]|nr:hypothetical protein [Microbacterium barkeri]MDI6942598.1 hypothetical protein [Microbacterium barkeri]
MSAPAPEIVRSASAQIAAFASASAEYAPVEVTALVEPSARKSATSSAVVTWMAGASAAAIVAPSRMSTTCASSGAATTIDPV